MLAFLCLCVWKRNENQAVRVICMEEETESHWSGWSGGGWGDGGWGGGG